MSSVTVGNSRAFPAGDDREETRYSDVRAVARKRAVLHYEAHSTEVNQRATNMFSEKSPHPNGS